jgi:hypothetical protein
MPLQGVAELIVFQHTHEDEADPGSLSGFICLTQTLLLQLVTDGPRSKAGTDRQIEQGGFSNEITLVPKGYLNACRLLSSSCSGRRIEATEQPWTSSIQRRTLPEDREVKIRHGSLQGTSVTRGLPKENIALS